MSTFVIADIGACHDGDFQLAMAAVEAAKAAGCDAIKFQMVTDPHRMARRRRKAAQHGYAEVYRRYLVPVCEWLEPLRAQCDLVGIQFMCTAFLPEDVEIVASYVDTFKVASFEASDREMWDALVPYVFGGKHVIASLGMGQQKMAGHGGVGVTSRLKWLHCVSAYPAPMESLGLDRIRRDSLNGFSDHSDPQLTYTGALAVAAGAQVVEAHLCLEETDPGNPDFMHAMVPRRFARYADAIRQAERAMPWAPGQHACEEKMSQYRVAL